MTTTNDLGAYYRDQITDLNAKRETLGEHYNDLMIAGDCRESPIARAVWAGIVALQDQITALYRELSDIEQIGVAA